MEQIVNSSEVINDKTQFPKIAEKLWANLEQSKSPDQILMNKELNYESLSSSKVKEFILNNRANEKIFTDEMVENVKKCISNELASMWYLVNQVNLLMPMDKKIIIMYVDSKVLNNQNKAIAWVVDIFDLKNLEKNYIIKAWDMVESNGGWMWLWPIGTFKIDKIDKDWFITAGGSTTSSWSIFKKIN